MTTTNSPQRSIWVKSQHPPIVQIIDQRFLPHQLKVVDIRSSIDATNAIREMWVRGAPLIGAMAAFGYWFAVLEASKRGNQEAFLFQLIDRLAQARPTAVNLQWAIDRQLDAAREVEDLADLPEKAFQVAQNIVEEDVAICKAIGQHGLPLLDSLHRQNPDRPVNILTHCNAGRMATVEWGTATSPIYQAHAAGIPIHVWVDETRPRNQGARITAWELGEAGISHTVITDNAGGYLMQQGKVDICLMGTDRTTRSGDVANKIGTYLKALAAWDNKLPFYVALPSSTIDWKIRDGLTEIPIEERDAREVSHIQGWSEVSQTRVEVRLLPLDSPAANYAFDVTPGKYISGLITEKGICEASEAGLLSLFPEQG